MYLNLWRIQIFVPAKVYAPRFVIIGDIKNEVTLDTNEKCNGLIKLWFSIPHFDLEYIFFIEAQFVSKIDNPYKMSRKTKPENIKWREVAWNSFSTEVNFLCLYYCMQWVAHSPTNRKVPGSIPGCGKSASE